MVNEDQTDRLDEALLPHRLRCLGCVWGEDNVVSLE